MLGLSIILNSLQLYTPVYYDQTKLMVQGGNPTRHERIKKKRNPIVRKLTKCWSRTEFMDGHESDECSKISQLEIKN
jgi:hypothetical protein